MILTREVRDKRVAIARDVLDRLDGGTLSVAPTQYIDGKLDGPLPEPDTDLKAIVDRVEANCNVCQLGALLLSKARLYDAVPVGTVVAFYDPTDPDSLLDRDGDLCADREEIYLNLEDVFDHRTLLSLEAAFERDVYHRGPSTELAVAFTRGLTVDDRVRKCMKYVIDHDGDFDP